MKKNTYSKKEFLKKMRMTSLDFQDWEKALKNNHTIMRSENNARIFTEKDLNLFIKLLDAYNQLNKSKEEIISMHFETTAIVPNQEKITLIDKNNSTPVEQLSTLISQQMEINMEKLKGDIIHSLSQQAEKTNQRLHTIDSHLKQVTQTSQDQAKEFNKVSQLMEENNRSQQETMDLFVQTMEETRMTNLEIAKNERDRFYQDVNEREAVFQDLITNFRQVAAHKEPSTKTPWWHFWKF